MMLLLDHKTDKHYHGSTYVELVYACGMVSFDIPKLTAYAPGRKFQYSSEYTPEEFVQQASKDIVRHMCDNLSFSLYKEVK